MYFSIDVLFIKGTDSVYSTRVLTLLILNLLTHKTARSISLCNLLNSMVSQYVRSSCIYSFIVDYII